MDSVGRARRGREPSPDKPVRLDELVRLDKPVRWDDPRSMCATWNVVDIGGRGE